jgi:hypothetical protein
VTQVFLVSAQQYYSQNKHFYFTMKLDTVSREYIILSGNRIMNTIIIRHNEIDDLRQKSAYFDGMIHFYETTGSTNAFNNEGNIILNRKELGLTSAAFNGLRHAIYNGYVRNEDTREFLKNYFMFDETSLNNPTVAMQNTASNIRKKPVAKIVKVPNMDYNNYNNSYSNVYNNTYNNSNNNVSNNTRNNNTLPPRIKINNINGEYNNNFNNNTIRKIKTAKANYSKYPKSGRRTMKRNIRKRNKTVHLRK